MRFMILLKYGPEGENGAAPDEKYMGEMGAFNEQLVQAGVMLGGEGLHPTTNGARVRFDSGDIRVIDGPFAETKELLAGYWIWKVDSKQDAIDWVKRIPMPAADTVSEIELRQVFEMDDFGPEMTPELRDQEERQRAQIAASQG